MKIHTFVVVVDDQVVFGSEMLAVAGAWCDANERGAIYELLSKAQEKPARRTVQEKSKMKKLA